MKSMRLALLLAVRAASVAGQILPAAAAFGDDLVAYYAFNEGSGFALKEAVSGRLDGKVIYSEGIQTVTYDQPNWQTDERFGTVISCGDATTLQKDTLELADVDYGKNGAFTMNVWFRHDKENFADLHKEVLFGHGDPSLAAGSNPNQLHVWLEQDHPLEGKWNGAYKDSGQIAVLLFDENDPPAYTCPYCESLGVLETDIIDASTNATCGEHADCWGRYRSTTLNLPSEVGGAGDIDNDNAWHMLTLTTHPDGAKGHSVYVDGKMVASQPYDGMGVDTMDWRVKAGFGVCYECVEISEYWLDLYQNTNLPGQCVDDDQTAADLALQQLGMTLPVPGACEQIGLAHQSSPTTPYCSLAPTQSACCATCNTVLGTTGDWVPERVAANVPASDRTYFAQGGDKIDPPGPMRFCGRLAGVGLDTYTADTQSWWAADKTLNANNAEVGWHKDRYFLGKLAHASFYSTAMSQSQVQFLYQSYLDHNYTPDSARAVALGSLALAGGLAALLL